MNLPEDLSNFSESDFLMVSSCLLVTLSVRQSMIWVGISSAISTQWWWWRGRQWRWWLSSVAMIASGGVEAARGRLVVQLARGRPWQRPYVSGKCWLGREGGVSIKVAVERRGPLIDDGMGGARMRLPCIVEDEWQPGRWGNCMKMVQQWQRCRWR